MHNNIKMPLYYKKIKNKINQIAFVLKSRQVINIFIALYTNYFSLFKNNEMSIKKVSIIEERQVSKISGKKIQVSKKYI